MCSGLRYLSEVVHRLQFAERFLTARAVAELVEQVGGRAWLAVPGQFETPSRNVYRLMRELCATRDLIKIQRDLYANLRARPIPAPEEAAQLLRPGAVVSLLTVLGQAGVVNNPTNVVFALFPSDENIGSRRTVSSPAVNGTVLEYGRFRFVSVKRAFLDAGVAQDRLANVGWPKATAERAFIDWIRLSATPPVRLSSPPFDCDTDLLNMDRLWRLAAATGTETSLAGWLDGKSKSDAAPDIDYCIPGVGR